MDLSQAAFQIDDIARAKAHDRPVERGVGERQCRHVSFDELGVPFACVPSALARSGEHRFAEIDAGNTRFGIVAHEVEAEVPGAAAEVEEPRAFRRREKRDRASPPELVEPAGEDAIGAVVAGGDRREHIAHEGSFIADAVTGRTLCHLYVLAFKASEASPVRDLSQRRNGVNDSPMVTLATTSAFITALQRARQIELASYALAPGPVEDALIAAARRGAAVSVALAGAPFVPAGPAAANGRALLRLRAAGVRADECAGAFHAKVARVDGALYLDDRNWSASGDTIVRVSSASDLGALATNKRSALAEEAALLATARRGARVEIESESFGSGSPIYALLRKLAARDVTVRLCVARADLRPDSAEDRALARLAEAGVRVRLGASDEKFAVLGERVWLGSANATYVAPGARDWGLQTRAAPVRAQLLRRFERTWARAEDFVAPVVQHPRSSAESPGKSARALASVRASTSSREIPSTSARRTAV